MLSVSFRTKLCKLLVPYSLLLGVTLNSAWAAPTWLPLVRNRVYKEGEVIKSPMKSDPAAVCVMKNLMFWLDAIDRPPRNVAERTPDFLSDYQYLSEKRYDNRLGKTNTVFDPEFDTRIYYSMTAKPRPDGTIPFVDPESKGLFVYIHGSGTNKASGANFSYKCTELSRLGYSCLSFDLPFHMDGNQDTKFATSERFMNMINKMIEKYRPPGVPVYLAGHSFGPEVVFEYAKRFPHSIDGVVALSPAAFNSDLNDWFNKVTAQATDFWGDTRPVALGGLWGGQVTAGFEWNKPLSLLPDPTIANPKLKVVVLTGDWEEYAPGPMDLNGNPAKASRNYDICAALKVHMANIFCTREPGVGHYIFAHKDEYGNDIVMRELLRVTQTDRTAMEHFPAKMTTELKALKAAADKKNLTDVDRLTQRYWREPFFRAWMDKYGGGLDRIKKMIAEKSQDDAMFVTREYALVLQARDQAVFDNIKNVQHFAPRFYEDNKQLIDVTYAAETSKDKRQDGLDRLLAKYFDFLEKSPDLHDQFRAQPSVLQISPEARAQLVMKRDKSQASRLPATGETIEVTLSDSKAFKFNPNVRPTTAEAPLILEQIALLREAGKHRDAQPLIAWVKRWLNYKMSANKTIESWSYKSDGK